MRSKKKRNKRYKLESAKLKVLQIDCGNITTYTVPVLPESCLVRDMPGGKPLVDVDPALVRSAGAGAAKLSLAATLGTASIAPGALAFADEAIANAASSTTATEQTTNEAQAEEQNTDDFGAEVSNTDIDTQEAIASTDDTEASQQDTPQTDSVVSLSATSVSSYNALATSNSLVVLAEEGEESVAGEAKEPTPEENLATLQAAIDKASADTSTPSIVLSNIFSSTNNIQIAGSIKVPASKVLNINIGNCTLNASCDTALFLLGGGCVLTLEGGGTIDATNCAALALNENENITAKIAHNPGTTIKGDPTVKTKALFTNDSNWVYKATCGTLNMLNPIEMNSSTELNIGTYAAIKSESKDYAIVLNDNSSILTINGSLDAVVNGIKVTSNPNITFAESTEITAAGGKVFSNEGNANPKISLVNDMVLSDATLAGYLTDGQCFVFTSNASQSRNFTVTDESKIDKASMHDAIDGIWCPTPDDYEALYDFLIGSENEPSEPPVDPDTPKEPDDGDTKPNDPPDVPPGGGTGPGTDGNTDTNTDSSNPPTTSTGTEENPTTNPTTEDPSVDDPGPVLDSKPEPEPQPEPIPELEPEPTPDPEPEPEEPTPSETGDQNTKEDLPTVPVEPQNPFSPNTTITSTLPGSNSRSNRDLSETTSNTSNESNSGSTSPNDVDGEEVTQQPENKYRITRTSEDINNSNAKLSSTSLRSVPNNNTDEKGSFPAVVVPLAIASGTAAAAVAAACTARFRKKNAKAAKKLLR